ncbi:MAG: 16S rRNA (adenine(1518)-N(6)/adenine(1519)-N(6))-dimethyltransferase RsmA [Candidatus Omnitrophota bacterium]
MNNKDFAKKSLGQNFLSDDNIKRKIIHACQLSKDDFVLEIGPGLGALTKDIAIGVKSITAVEKDVRLCGHLVILLDDYKNLILINEDILKFKITQKNTKVVGNIPYNISSPIIEHLINQRDKISVIYISLQKELARRIIAKPGGKDYSSFSLFVQYYTIPEIKFIIKRGSFKPQPKVDSAFVELIVRKVPAVKVKNEELLFRIIRACFNQRRKMISNTLRDFVRADKISQIDIDQNCRPEELSLQDFAKIADFVVK